MTRTTVVTGGSGFVGQRLTRALLERGDDVWVAGLGARPQGPPILLRAEWNAVHWTPCDVTSDADVVALIASAKPDLVFHLAGVSFVPDADRAPTKAFEVNVLGAVRVASALARQRSTRSDPTLIVVGSGTQYGSHPEREMPLAESAEQRPASVYAATKSAQEIAALQIGRASGLRVIATRSFNHSGVGHDPAFLLPSLVARVRALGPGGTLSIGNDVVRDYTHVDDVVEAYLLLAERGQPGEVYNVASGKGVGTRELADAVLARAGHSATVVSDPSLQRSVDMPILIGLAEKLRRATGWTPRKTHLDIIEDLLGA